MPGSGKAPGSKRLRIIAAATTVFSRKGFHRAKIEEIAEEARVGKGTVYEYFTSKKELFREMLLHSQQIYREKMEQELAGATTLLDRLQTMFAVTVQFLSRHKEIARLLLADHPPVGEDIQQILLQKEQDEIEELSAALEAMIARGEIRPVNTHAAALVILGALYLVSGQIIFHEYNKQQDINQLSQDTIGIILQGLAPESGLNNASARRY